MLFELTVGTKFDTLNSYAGGAINHIGFEADRPTGGGV